jgi:hypothetical protein
MRSVAGSSGAGSFGYGAVSRAIGIKERGGPRDSKAWDTLRARKIGRSGERCRIIRAKAMVDALPADNCECDKYTQAGHLSS